ncbi:MAG: nuclear transport factor 2 family protein [Capsulimonadales bacterium]|nr:nuclear transport factor 2 family protein [Capsulimonadales bacterium]
MTVSEIAGSLVALCREGKFDDAYSTLFAENARSIEPDGATATGLDALHAKAAAWGAANDIRSVSVTGPFLGGDSFAVVFTMEIVQKESGNVAQFAEIALYAVQDGKITEERFLYGQ